MVATLEICHVQVFRPSASGLRIIHTEPNKTFYWIAVKELRSNYHNGYL